MRVSVIVPAYNEEESIGACLESLGKQTHKDVEIIVVDDSSTDRTVEIAESMGAKVLKQDHRGPGLARNLGAEHATGEIVSFLDADMTFAPEFLECLVKPIEEGKAIGTSSREEFVANVDNVWARCWTINQGLPRGRRHALDFPDEDIVFRAILKDVFLSVGGYDDVGCSQDHTISRKLGGKKALCAPGSVCYHRNPGSLREVYQDARWYGKGEQIRRDFGFIIRRTLPFTIKNGIKRAYRNRTWQCMPFQFAYDLGVLRGMLARAMSSKNHMK